VCVPYVAAAEWITYEQPHLRRGYELGWEPLVKTKSIVERMAARCAALSERVEFVKLIGLDATFEVVCAAA
jgi:hypothetical protein